MEYAIDKNIRLSSNSWGGHSYNQAMYDVIEAAQAAGHIFVAAAGNDGINNDYDPHYPSSYEVPNIIAVAATDNDDNLAAFSCYGPATVDLGAPGVNTYSSTLGGSYSYLNGTSMATPHVTGVVALVMSRRPDWTWPEVKGRVLAGVRPVDSLIGITLTGGVVSALNVGDCNENGIADELDIAGGTSADCSGNAIPDECEPDCNGNGEADSCDILAGTSMDCNGNVIPDQCEPDCNNNGAADSCDVAAGISEDCNHNVIPDECEVDCNVNGVPDDCDIASGTSEDCSANGIPDECETSPDCNDNGVGDANDICTGISKDCNTNEVPDECDLADGACEDCNENLIPDECEIGLRVLLLDLNAEEEFVSAIQQAGHFVTQVCYASIYSDLSDYDVLAFGPIQAHDSSFMNVIDNFVAGGGGIIMWAVSVSESWLYSGSASPVIGGEGWEFRAETDVVDFESPLVSGLDASSNLRGWSTTPTLRPEAQVAINWSDGVPMAVTHAYGNGHVVYINDYWMAHVYYWRGDPDYGTALLMNALDYVGRVPNDCNGNGVVDSCEVADGSVADDNHNGIPDVCDMIVFVDAAGPGGDGQSWANAYQDLQTALADETATEIWVAAGTYTPTGPGGDRYATFQLRGSARVIGGFAGWESRLDQRDPTANPTILSGDLNRDDGSDWANRQDNSYHVVTATAVNETAMLDGFTLTGGEYAPWPDIYAGGMYIENGRLTVANCRFIRNRAFDAAAMYIDLNSRPNLIDCTFSENSASGYGGAIENLGKPTMTNCVFTGNEANRGGALNTLTEATLANCTFVGNHANLNGGGIYNSGSLTLSNCILWDNTDEEQTGEGAQIRSADSGDSVDVNYCCVEGWSGNFGGVGNTGDNPLFVDADGDDDTIGTADDDLRLSAGSPGIDAGDNTAIHAHVTTDMNGEPRFLNDADTLDTGFGVPPIVDMGAYEYVPDCNGNGVSDAEDIDHGTSADCNDNYAPDECDIAGGFSDDCTNNGVPDECETLPDCNSNGTADGNDVCTGASANCNFNSVPDECEPDEDCNENGIRDICDIGAGTSADCNVNNTPDDCDLSAGTSSDDNSNGIPDECDRAPAVQGAGPSCNVAGDCAEAWAGADCVGGRCYIAKNRYVSIDPTTNTGLVAYQVELTEAADYPAAQGRSWWVDQPDCYDFPNGDVVEPRPSSCEGADRFGWVSKLASTPVTRVWAEPTLHVTGCPVVPAATYGIRASADGGLSFSESLEVNTVHAPAGESQSWGDVTAGPAPDSPGSWLAPEGTTNFGDVGNAIRTFENRLDDTGHPPRVWVDMEINQVVNLGDISFIVMAFEGRAYADIQLGLIGVDPADCP